MLDDGFVRALFDLDAARSVLADQLASLGKAIETIARRRESGQRIRSIAETIETIGRRPPVLDALTGFSMAYAAMRAEGIRMLADEERLPLAEIGRLLGVSRQVVSRIFNDRSA